MPVGYGKIPDNEWHISTLVIAIPFTGKPNEREVKQAMAQLSTIVASYKKQLKDVIYSFDKLESIGNHKFIAAHYDFKAGRRRFLEAYAHIIAEFLKKYPNAWLFYGYKTIPHISVASTGQLASQKIINMQACKPINDVKLLHAGRNMYVSGGFFNLQTNKLERFKSAPI